MAIPRWRLALTGGALVVLSVAGVGLTWAATTPADDPADGLAKLVAGARVGAGPGRLVHGTVTVDRPGEGIVTVQLDGGTISAIDADSVSIAEADGSTVTVAIDGETRFRVDRRRAAVGDLEPGQRVRVVSRVGDGGTATARLISVLPASR